MNALLNDENAVRRYLVSKGLVNRTASMVVEPLSGGVSNDVWKVAGEGFRWVMKQALPKLKVQVDWYSDVGRIEREQEAMLALGPLLPNGSVPEIVHRDPDAHVYVMTCAPDEAECWKDQLMAGRLDGRTAREAGRLLRRMHDATRARASVLQPAFGDTGFFEELRIDPFHRYVADRHPGLADAIAQLIDDLVLEGSCLVHGDFSPKNILVVADEPDPSLVLLDYEVAHWGNPVFDQAFCCGHLMLKGWALGRGSAAAQMIDVFLDGYGGPCSGLLGHLGLMLLARVDGKSTVSYITDEGLEENIRNVGGEWILGDGTGPDVSAAVHAALTRDL